jgi:hypothetical protein
MKKEHKEKIELAFKCFSAAEENATVEYNAITDMIYSFGLLVEVITDLSNTVQRMEIEQNPKYIKWKEDLDYLNSAINNLKVWDEYAEALQRKYDRLLDQDPRKDIM